MLIGVVRLGRNRTVEKSLGKFARRRRSENEGGGIGNRKGDLERQPTTSAVSAKFASGRSGRHLLTAPPFFSTLPEPDDRRDHDENVRNERGGAGIILGHALTEEEREQSKAGEGRTIEGDRGIVPEQDHYAADGAERSGSEFHYRNGAEQQTDNSCQWTLREVSRKPFQVAAAIDDFIAP